uniref:FUZ/MON1/HPS1 first Longin domain-containing protein n=1 Tax=Clastoptera arizonana TaxID=38151 RepID=A0A1B6C2U9_9HEMI
MHCILLFDHRNDIIFSKFDQKFALHINYLGVLQGLISKDEKNNEINKNVLIQLFAPLVTSQQIMSSQFSNSYTSIQCQDGTNMVFDEYMGYLFVHMGDEDVSWLKRALSVCICFVQHLCGPDVAELQINNSRSQLLAHLLDTWISLADKDQGCLVEAVEQLTINAELSNTVIKILKDAANKVKSMTEYSHVHALIFVDNKFVSLYSTKEAEELAPVDILFLNILNKSFWWSTNKFKDQDSDDDDDAKEEYFSPQSSPKHMPEDCSYNNVKSKIFNNSGGNMMLHEIVVLCGNGMFSPHAVHISKLEDNISLLLLYQVGNEVLCGGLHDAFSSIVVLQNTELNEGSDDLIHRTLDICEGGIKRIHDIIKKYKMTAVEVNVRQMQIKWEFIRRRYNECFKDKESGGGLETSCSSLCDSLRQILQLTCLNKNLVTNGIECVTMVRSQVQSEMKDFMTFLKVKAECNFTLGSYPF